MNELRILHVIPNLVKGGAQRIALDICNELQKKTKVKVALIYWEGENQFGFLTEDLDVHKLRIKYLLSFSGKHKINISEYEAFVDDFKPDIINTHLYPAELVTRENTRKDVLYFTHCHDNIRQFQRWNIKMMGSKQKSVEYMERKRLMKRYRGCNNQFIAISRDVQLYLERNLSKSLLNNIHLFANGFNYEGFFDEVKSDLSHPVRLINVGNFVPVKNQEFLVQCLKQLHKVDVLLRLVGDGVTREEVEEVVTQLELSDSVQFLGTPDHISKELASSDIYVHASKSEAFGLVLLEAMAAGLPVVSLDGKGNRDLIQDGINGFIVEQNDIDTFVQRIIDLIEDKELYNRIALKGQESAKKYDIRNYTDQLIQIYQHAVRGSTMGRE